MVVPRIEPDADDVRRRHLIAAAEAFGDLIRRPVVAAQRDVQEPIVVRHLKACPLGQRLVVVRIPLDEVLADFRVDPHFVVERAVDARRIAGHAQRVQHFAHFRAGSGF